MESSIATVEQQIQAQIEDLRGKFPHTQELYREVCILLFFRHGITPTANKLYQYVRKGSMSAPAEALNKFWADLREKSRARVEHPDLPEEIKMAAGELAATLWTKAQGLAQASLAALQSEAQARVAEAKAGEDAAKQHLETVSADLADARQAMEATQERIRAVEQTLAGETATRKATAEQLRAAQEANAAAQQATEDARREFAAELEKLRTAAKLSEERYQAAEQRALLEIDRERTTATRTQKELEAAREVAAAATRHRAEIEALQTQMGDLRQHAGVLEGNLQAMKSSQERLVADLSEAQDRLEHAQAQVTTVAVDRDNWQRSTVEATQTIEALRRELEERPKAKSGRAVQGGKGKKDLFPTEHDNS